MNGATAVPFVSTMSPPKMAMTMNTGSSQYFLRSRKNAANSRRKDTIVLRIGSSGYRGAGLEAVAIPSSSYAPAPSEAAKGLFR